MYSYNIIKVYSPNVKKSLFSTHKGTFTKLSIWVPYQQYMGTIPAVYGYHTSSILVPHQQYMGTIPAVYFQFAKIYWY